MTWVAKILVQNRKRIDCVAVFVDGEVEVRTCTKAGASYKTNLGFLSVNKIAFLAGDFAHVAVQGFIT